MSTDAHNAETPDPATAERVRVQKQFETSMDDHGLLEEDGSLALEPDQIEHDTPPDAEQSAG